ncbi:sensor domain-containing diguanylate cyclase [Aquibacillus saliphilus]|uniref:sensor domain-containing diguanylate cyclase n=1 Tax=Aquibacillus saliphilus TaxID=1909422 RepID=UPI001CF09836
MVTKSKQIIIWLTWLIVLPISLIVIYQVSTSNVEWQWLEIISFALLVCIVAFFPLMVSNTPIFFVNGISFAVFLYYGLVIEVLLTQLSVLALMAKLRLERKEIFRLPLNMLMFLFISILSASVYSLLGGVTGEIYFNSVTDVVAAIGYVVTVTLSNQLLLYLLYRTIYNVEKKLVDMGFAWEIFTTLLVLPVGFTLYLMYRDFGISAIYFVGLPFISISFILMLYYTSRNINNYLQKTSEIGHELTGQMEINEVVDLFIDRVTGLLPVDYAFVYEVIDEETMELTRFYDKGDKLDFPTKTRLAKFEAISGNVWGNNKGVHYQNRQKWSHLKDIDFPELGESVVSLPVERNNVVTAVITLSSKKKRAFEKYQIMILNILINYLAVALENAKNYEETKRKSEIDPLTKLFNFRYFQDYLEDYMNDVNQNEEHTSLILLDLDHFKAVNDTYGHQSGNEILKDLALRLTTVIGNSGTVARYGGEEFVIFLPNTSKQQSHYVAEDLRKEIADLPFLLSDHILESNQSIEVQVTASIGIATCPEDCDVPLELIRHADRAMYLGAKQKGRNKVAAYER